MRTVVLSKTINLLLCARAADIRAAEDAVAAAVAADAAAADAGNTCCLRYM